MKTFRCASLWLPQLNRAKKEEVKLKRARRKTIGVTINPFCGTTLILHSVGTYRDKSNLWPPYWVLKILQQVFNRPFRLPEKYGLVWLFGLSLYCCRLLTLQWKLPWDDDVVVIWWCVKKVNRIAGVPGENPCRNGGACKLHWSPQTSRLKPTTVFLWSKITNHCISRYTYSKWNTQ